MNRKQTTTKMGRRLISAAFVAAALFTGTVAAAESIGISPEIRSSLSDRIEVKLRGRIEPRCLISGGGEMDFGQLRGGEGGSARLGLDCNVPFDIDMVSSHGGLAHVTQPLGEGPFSGLLEYDVRLSVPTLRPTPATVQASYSSRQLISRRTLSSGDGISAGGGRLEFRMRAPVGAGLLAGRYRETLTLTVTPRM